MRTPKFWILFCLGITYGFTLWIPAYAGEPQFQTTKQGIINALTPAPKTRSFKTRSITIPKPAKTRQIKVMARERGILVEKQITVSENSAESKVNLKIEFDVNTYTIRPESFPILNELGRALTCAELEKIAVVIKGHTDSDGNDTYNLELSLKRALAVKSFLAGNFAIPDSRVTVIGMGEALPLLPNTTSRNKQINRRVEIVTAQQ